MKRICAMLAVVALAGMGPGVSAAATSKPEVSLPLEQLGVPATGMNRQRSGMAVNSIHFVDSEHILVTFTMRGLLERIPDDPPSDEDRKVAAVLVELPTGRVLARTEWRLHDFSPYLWELGDGQFLLRLENKLVTFAPLAHLKDGAFAEHTLVTVNPGLVIVGVNVTVDQAVLILQTETRKDYEADLALSYGGGMVSDPMARQSEVQVRFMRLFPAATLGGPLSLRVDSGLLRHNNALFAITGGGFLVRRADGANQWDFEYRDYTGKTTPLASYETSCEPFTAFVSRSEFVSFGCRGSYDRAMMAGFNLHGDEMWQMNFNENQLHTGLSAAPAAGRFAISRGLSNNVISRPGWPLRVASQEVRVVQAYDGKQLLQEQCWPVQLDGANFSLSPDGMELAVLQEGGLNIYRLPALSDEDKKQVAAERAKDPKVDTSLPVNLGVALGTADAPPAR